MLNLLSLLFLLFRQILYNHQTLRLDLKLNLLRYNVSDNQGVRGEVSSVLLYLNRDDDCFQYIKWWTYNYNSNYTRGVGNDANCANLWGKGEFVYREAGGSRFDDIFVMFNDTGDLLNPPWTDGQMREQGVQYNYYGANREASLNLDFLVPLVVIKMRIVKHLDDQLVRIDRVEGEAQRSDVFTDVTTRTTIVEKRKQQYDLMNKYLHMVHKTNKYVLHTFGAAESMWNQGRPDSYSWNSPEEAFLTMERYMRNIGRVPSGLLMVTEFLDGIGETVCPDLTYKRYNR